MRDYPIDTKNPISNSENVYDTNFIQRIPLIEQQHNDVDHVTLHQRLEDIQLHLNQGATNIAEQIIQKSEVKSLRVPRRSWPAAPIDIHNDDLLSREI
jgi:hypothetical protein